MMRKLSANCREKGMGYGAGDRARELFVLASPNIVKRYTTWKHCVTIGKKRKLRAARGSGISATNIRIITFITSGRELYTARTLPRRMEGLTTSEKERSVRISFKPRAGWVSPRQPFARRAVGSATSSLRARPFGRFALMFLRQKRRA